MHPRWKRLAAIEYADVVEAEEPALKHVSPGYVLSIHPPTEVEHQLVEHALQVDAVTLPSGLSVGLVNLPGSPGVHWRIGVAERPLVAWELAVRVLELVPGQQQDLPLGELGVDPGE